MVGYSVKKTTNGHEDTRMGLLIRNSFVPIRVHSWFEFAEPGVKSEPPHVGSYNPAILISALVCKHS